MPVSSAAAGIGLLAVVAGSLGPWATVLGVSVAGTRGDGRLTLIAAAVALLALVVFGAVGAGAALIASLVALGIGVYDLVHFQRAVSHATVLGVQVASAGWGLYLVIIGAAGAAAALVARSWALWHEL